MAKKDSRTADTSTPVPSAGDFNEYKAATYVVHQCFRLLGPLDGRRVLFVVGKGPLSVTAVASAVELRLEGGRPTILLAFPREDAPLDALPFLRHAETLGADVYVWKPDTPSSLYDEQDLLVDALSNGQGGDPPSPLDNIIKEMNASRVPIVALDCPCGLDPATGEPGQPTVRAAMTIQFSKKTKLTSAKDADKYTGKIVTA